MTWSFLEAVRSRRTMTYGELLDSMRAKVHHRLQQSSSGKCVVTGCLGSLAAKCLPCCFLSVQVREIDHHQRESINPSFDILPPFRSFLNI